MEMLPAPLPYFSQPCGYVKVLAPNFSFRPPHPFSPVFLAVPLSLSQNSYVLGRDNHGAHTTRASRNGSQSSHPGAVPGDIPASYLGTLILAPTALNRAPDFHKVWELRDEQQRSSQGNVNTAKTEGCSPVKLINTFFQFFPVPPPLGTFSQVAMDSTS